MIEFSVCRPPQHTRLPPRSRGRLDGAARHGGEDQGGAGYRRFEGTAAAVRWLGLGFSTSLQREREREGEARERDEGEMRTAPVVHILAKEQASRRWHGTAAASFWPEGRRRKEKILTDNPLDFFENTKTFKTATSHS